MKQLFWNSRATIVNWDIFQEDDPLYRIHPSIENVLKILSIFYSTWKYLYIFNTNDFFALRLII